MGTRSKLWTLNYEHWTLKVSHVCLQTSPPAPGERVITFSRTLMTTGAESLHMGLVVCSWILGSQTSESKVEDRPSFLYLNHVGHFNLDFKCSYAHLIILVNSGHQFIHCMVLLWVRYNVKLCCLFSCWFAKEANGANNKQRIAIFMTQSQRRTGTYGRGLGPHM